MGFSEIYIIGVDLTYTIPDNVSRKGTVLTSNDIDPNHYDKNYFGPGKRWHIPEPERMSQAFQYAHNILKENNQISIINSGIGGNLNCFRRVDFDSLFNEI